MTLQEIFALHPWMNSKSRDFGAGAVPQFFPGTSEGATGGWYVDHVSNQIQNYDPQTQTYTVQVSTPEGLQARQRFDLRGSPVSEAEVPIMDPSNNGNVQWVPYSQHGGAGLKAGHNSFIDAKDLFQIGSMAAAAFGPAFLQGIPGIPDPTWVSQMGGATAGAAGTAGAAATAAANMTPGPGANVTGAGLGGAGTVGTSAATTALSGGGADATGAFDQYGAINRPGNGSPLTIYDMARTGGGAGAGGLAGTIDRIWNGTGTPGDYAALGIGAGVPLLGAMIQGNAAGRAADTQAAATIGAIGEQRRQFDLARADTAPYREQGQKAVGELGQRTLAGGDLMRPFTLDDFWKDPVTQASYQAGLEQGTKAINNMAPLTTGRDSGAAIKELTKFATDWTGQQAAGSHARYTSDRGNWWNRLAALAGIGQTGVAQATGAGTAASGNISNLISSGGDARGASQIAQGNAYGNALSSISNWWQGQDMLDRLLKSRGGYAYA